MEKSGLVIYLLRNPPGPFDFEKEADVGLFDLDTVFTLQYTVFVSRERSTYIAAVTIA